MITIDPAALDALKAALADQDVALSKFQSGLDALADAHTELVTKLEALLEPDPLPALILSRSNVTGVEELPAGALRDMKTVVLAVKLRQSAAGKRGRLMGIDSTKNEYGGFCLEYTPKGELSVWVYVDGKQQAIRDPIQVGKPWFICIPIRQDMVGLTIGQGEKLIDLPGSPDDFDGPAAIGAGYWAHKLVDPADAEILRLEVYRTLLTEAEIAAKRAEWAAVLVVPEPAPDPEPDPEPEPDPTPDPIPPLPGDGLEPINTQATQASLTVVAGERHRWEGFGWTMSSPGAAPQVASLAARYPTKLFEDLNTRWLGGYSANSAYKAGAKLGRDHGVTGMFLHEFLYRHKTTPKAIADRIKADWDNGIEWTEFCAQNEPDGNAGNRWPSYPGSLRLVVDDTMEIRKNLDARGLKQVRIVTNTYAHFGPMVDAEFDAFKAAGALDEIYALGGHCYSDCPTDQNNERARQLNREVGLRSTETGYGDVPNSAARFFAATNNGAGVHMHFEGQGVGMGAEAQKNCLIDANGSPRPWYNAYKLISPPLTVGSVFRLVTCSDRPAGMPSTYAERMIRQRSTRGLIFPKINATCAKRPDGKWYIGACNATKGTTVHAGTLAMHWGAELFQLTVRIAELAGKNGSFVAQRCDGSGAIKGPQSIEIKDGHLRFTVAPSETVVLVGG